jgi:hypothetical protein
MHWWHICIFTDTQSQKNAKEPPANAPRHDNKSRNEQSEKGTRA